MISNIVSIFKAELDALGIFCELGGLAKPVPIKDRVLPFSCDLALDECKSGADIAPTGKNALVGFFEQIGEVGVKGESSQRGGCSWTLYEGRVNLVVWYDCNKVKITNNDIEIACCDKEGFIAEKLINTLNATMFTSNLFSTVVVGNMTIAPYTFAKYQINERLKHHPYSAFEISIPVEFILNKSCAGGLDINITKEPC